MLVNCVEYVNTLSSYQRCSWWQVDAAGRQMGNVRLLLSNIGSQGAVMKMSVCRGSVVKRALRRAPAISGVQMHVLRGGVV